MLIKIRELLTPPIFEDTEKTRVAHLLHTLLFIALGVSLLSSSIMLLTKPTPMSGLILIESVTVLLIGAFFIMQRGYIRVAALTLIISLWGFIVSGAYLFGGVGSPFYLSLIFIILAAGVLLNIRAALICTGISILFGLVLLYLELHQWLPPALVPITPISTLGGLIVNFLITAVFVGLTTRSLTSALNNARFEIAERKRIEEALRESEARYRTILENITDGYYEADLTGAITFFNDALCHILGYSADELIGSTYQHLYTPDIAQKAYQTYREVYRTGNPIKRVEYEAIAKDGSIRFVEVSIILIKDVDDQAIGFRGIIRDVSERKQAEKQLAAYAAELDRSNGELQNFAYIASHDLQEPLRKIQTFGQRLQTKYEDTLTGRGIEYLNRIQGATARMQILIHDLLAFSRVTTQAKPFSPANLNQVIRGVLSDLEISIADTGAAIEVGDLPTIEADSTQMRQLFQNLLSNALKFHREGEIPVIKIEAVIPASSDIPPNMCQILVKDNGIGFEEKYLERIFGIFERLHGRHHYEGTGIGLAICRKIVERHGGTITAQSQLDQGATFIITLPVKQPTTAPPQNNHHNQHPATHHSPQ